MARIVKVIGDSACEHLLDLDLNPWAEEQIATGRLTVVAELDALPADPWAEKAKRPKPAEKEV